MVVVKPGVWCDPCIADLVAALNYSGFPTIASCCGHGENPGRITLADERELILAPTFQVAEQLQDAPSLAASLDLALSESQRLRAALDDAIETVEHWAGYASDHFQEKWDLAGDIARLRAALSDQPSTPPDVRTEQTEGVDIIGLVAELRRTVGLFDGAMPITPKAAWDEAIERVRLMATGRCHACMVKDDLALSENERLREALERSHLARIKAQNPGIDIARVHAGRVESGRAHAELHWVTSSSTAAALSDHPEAPS